VQYPIGGYLIYHRHDPNPQRVEKEKVVILNYNELINILNDTQTVRRAVLVCFSSDFSVAKNSFRPLVEPRNPNILSNDNAKYELRILDGGLFNAYG